jgi:hypothetical protein
MEAVPVNWWAVIVAAVVSFIIGAIYYAPPVLGNVWRSHVKMTEEEVRAGLVPAMIAQIIRDLVTAYILARFIVEYGAPTLTRGILVGFMAWLGFVATVTMGQVFYERRPWALWLISNGYLIISLVVMGAILGWWHAGVAAAPVATPAA